MAHNPVTRMIALMAVPSIRRCIPAACKRSCGNICIRVGVRPSVTQPWISFWLHYHIITKSSHKVCVPSRLPWSWVLISGQPVIAPHRKYAWNVAWYVSNQHLWAVCQTGYMALYKCCNWIELNLFITWRKCLFKKYDTHSNGWSVVPLFWW